MKAKWMQWSKCRIFPKRTQKINVCPGNRGSTYRRNVGKLQPGYKGQYPTRHSTSYALPSETEISTNNVYQLPKRMIHCQLPQEKAFISRCQTARQQQQMRFVVFVTLSRRIPVLLNLLNITCCL